MKHLLIILIVTLLSSCKTSASLQNIAEQRVKNPNTEYISCVLVEKEFINKGGKVTEYKELYLQCSVQDYFIKICESNVTIEDLKPYINSGIKVKMEIKDGMWDHCSDDPAYAQSRMGTYVIITEIVK
ncbi:MAG: hypothetical protein AB7O47_04680 [Flavobacteriales bacterium]